MQPVPVSFPASGDPVEVAIDELTLEPDSRCMVRRVLDPEADVQVLAWCWDLSGRPPVVRPDDPHGGGAWRLALAGPSRTTKAPLPLWHAPVVGGLVVRVIVWEGRHPDLAAEIAEAMRHSALTAALAAVAPPAPTTVMSAMAVRGAAAALGTDIAPVLRALCPDYLDFFEAYLPATAAPGEQQHRVLHGGLTIRVRPAAGAADGSGR
ncbi:hypothetical protein [Paractinoplanes rishiriensis]|uniref:Uncharacterized protein n=1 Tax=Paractinoplanes rishiriensis TaxID=1050105 RepID=A0A919K5Z6_9ACTN|nr:hypothetical protein [Actinoplanes rishiriensis]GIE99535.1 hypothetical protein Ari01nite_70000 [Actinoplanes rishiriensis]